MGKKNKGQQGKKLLLGTALMVLVGNLSGCGTSARVPLPVVEVEDYQRLTLETYDVKRLQVDPVVTLNLESTGMETKDYYPLGEGIKLAEIYVRAGDTVKEGDELFRYDAGKLKEQIAEYEKRVTTNKMLKEHYEKLQEIEETDQRKRVLEQLAGSIQVDELYIAELRERINANCVVAEGAGLVTEVIEGAENQKITDDQKLMSITYSEGKYHADCYEELVLQEGDIYEYSSGVTTLQFQYTGMETVGDKFRYWFQFVPGEQGFCGRILVQMDVPQPTISASLVVPEEYVVEAENKYYVFLLNEEGRARAREVQIEEFVGGKVIVAEGLHEGDQVVKR